MTTKTMVAIEVDFVEEVDFAEEVAFVEIEDGEMGDITGMTGYTFSVLIFMLCWMFADVISKMLNC